MVRRRDVPLSLLGPLVFGTLLNPLNSSMIAVALVPMQHAFGVGVATSTWLVSGFYLAAAVGQPLMGRLVDLFGARRLFVAGLLVVCTASVLAPFAPGFWWLVGLRVLLAAGTSTAFPAAIVLIRGAMRPDARANPGGAPPGLTAVDGDLTGPGAGVSEAPPRRPHARRADPGREPAGTDGAGDGAGPDRDDDAGSTPANALAVITVAASTSAALGPVLGGFLVAFAGWPAVFLVNIPVTVLGIVLALRYLPPSRPAHGRSGSSSAPAPPSTGTGGAASFARTVDLPGLLLFSGTLTALLVFLLSLAERPMWWLTPVVVVLAVVLILHERRTETPFLDVRGLVANRRLSAVLSQQGGFNLVFYCVFFGLPLWLGSVRDFDADTVGLLVLPVAAMAVLMTPLAARLVSRRGSRATLVLGAVVLLLATLLVQIFTDTTPVLVLVAVALLFGVPGGFTNLGLQSALYEASPPDRMGSSSGLFQTFRYLGAIGATSVLGIVLERDLSTRGFHLVGLIMTGVAVGILVLAFLAGGRERPGVQPAGPRQG
jgi:MFS family permease